MPSSGLPPLIIKRPSGVWNTRAPMHAFLVQINRAQIRYSTLTLAITRTRYDLDHRAPTSTKSPARFLHARESGEVASKAWTNYRDAWNRLFPPSSGRPDLSDLGQSLATGLYAVREDGILRCAAIFETFLLCWALNALLTLLELHGGLTTPAQEALAERFSPFSPKRHHTPPAFKVLDAFPDAMAQLARLPHISTDPVTGASITEPVADQLTALNVLTFWKDFRNLIIHRGNRLSLGFCRKYGALFEQLRKPYAAVLRPLDPIRSLQLPNPVFYATLTTHLKAARCLNTYLRTLSEERRGRLTPPGSLEPDTFHATNRPPPLLQPGDHEDSLKWATDPDYQLALKKQFPPPQPARGA